MSSADEKYQHMTCTDELNNMHFTGTDEIIDRCANCGEEGNDLNICNKCKTVKYCNVTCKKKHKSQHKKKCDRRVAELHDEALFSESPPREECPICMIPLPHNPGESLFKSCCGKRICGGCAFAIVGEDMKRGKKKEDRLCPYCRTPRAKSDEEGVKRLKTLMENGNAIAYCQLGHFYYSGTNGMPQNWAKANELYLKAGDLGCAEAYNSLGISYREGRGVEADKKKAKHYYEQAAMNGNAEARHDIGCMEGQTGHHRRAMKHFMLAAKAGDKGSLEYVKKGFTNGIVTKDEYESTLRAYYKSASDMKREARDKVAAFLSTLGQF